MRLESQFLILLTVLLMCSHARAQGSAVVMPMSKYVLNKDEVVNFSIYNQLNEALLLNITPKCDVDGQILEGEQCAQFFSLQFQSGASSGKVDVAKGGSVQASVKLVGGPKRYALFKPLISPVFNKKSSESSVGFEFRYQPGYLFIISQEKSEFPPPKVSFRSTSEEKIAVLDFDLKSLPMPSVATLSAKVIDQKSNKLIRFVRLASEKIFDPARGQIKLEAGYASPKDERAICLDIIVQWLATNSVQKINSCAAN